MLATKMSRMVMMVTVLSVLALLAAGPIWAQGPSESALPGGPAQRDQWQIVADELAASGYTLAAPAEAAIPSALPVTGSSVAILTDDGTPQGRAQLDAVASEFTAAGIPFEVGNPEVLPVTGGGTEQVPPFLTPQVQTPATGPDPVMGAIMAPVTEPPAQLPATGQQQNPYIELMPLFRHMYGGY